MRLLLLASPFVMIASAHAVETEMETRLNTAAETRQLLSKLNAASASPAQAESIFGKGFRIVKKGPARTVASYDVGFGTPMRLRTTATATRPINFKPNGA